MSEPSHADDAMNDWLAGDAAEYDQNPDAFDDDGYKVKHQRSAFILSAGFSGRICIGCMQSWPCPDAPADGSDGWDEPEEAKT